MAAHSRASLADALATVTPLLTRETSRRPPTSRLRAALYRYAFNAQQRRSRTGSGHRQHAGLAGTRVAAGRPAQRPADHPDCPGRAVHTPGRLTCGGEHDHPQAGVVPWRPRLRGRARAACRQPGRSGAMARADRRRRYQSIHPPSPARRRSGRSWPRSFSSGRIWSRSSAACTTLRCARRKPLRCAAATLSSQHMAAGR